jgi:hypothetical protein
MKHASLLIAFCVLFGLSAVAQTTTTVEKNTKRITITTKKVDENGKTITETYIAEGDEPAKILSEMAINPEIIQQVQVEGDVKTADQERLFLFRSAGDNVVIEGTLDENVDKEEISQVIVITNTDDASAPTEYKKISRWSGQGSKNMVYAGAPYGGQKSNCAALGVYADAHPDSYGAKINRLIEKGGAQEAGLIEGDIIKKIDEFDVSDFATLHFALSHFRPGDQVTVRYERDGKSLKAKVDLKDWAQLPGHEFRSRSDCGQPEVPVSPDTRQDIGDEPSALPNIQPLMLEDARVYPNPTDGLFAFSFNTNPGPVNVSVTDPTGKVVFSDLNENPSGYYNREIDIKNLPQGNYILSVRQGDKVFTQQISKQ